MSDDALIARRARLARLAGAGRRLGYGCVLLSVAAFFAGLAWGYRIWGPIVVAALVGSAVTLAPAFVVGYGVRAAERDDRRPRPGR